MGILLSILVPGLMKSRELARRAVCLSNQKQIYTASILYSNANNFKYPQRMPSRHWPFGHYNSTDSTTDGYTAEEENLALKISGVSALVESELITAYEVFYCPSSKWPAASTNLPRIRPGSTENWSVNYSYWPGYKSALDVDDNIATIWPENNDSDAMFMSDIIGSVAALACHTSNGITAGGGITLNDGSAKWRNYSSMRYRFERHGVNFWW